MCFSFLVKTIYRIIVNSRFVVAIQQLLFSDTVDIYCFNFIHFHYDFMKLLYFQGGKKKTPHTTRSITYLTETVVASYHVIEDHFHQETPKNIGTKVSLKNGIYF